MTSQVAVSNFYGVAVASDTVSSRNTRNGMKTVTHTNKIYELGPEHQVLVLHSGSSVTNNVPAWLLVTEWSKTLTGRLETVQDYIDSFLRWTSEAAPLHTKQSEQDYLNMRMNNHFAELSKATQDEIDAMNEAASDSATPVDPRAVLLSKIELNTNWLKEQKKLEGLTLEESEEIVKSFTGDLPGKIKYWFEKFNVDKKDHVLLEKSIAHAVQTADYLQGDDSWLAFVGFGSTQSFPVNRQVQCRSYYNGKLRVIQRQAFDYSPSDNWVPGIDFFAQSQAIRGFIQGYHPETLPQIGEFVKQSMLEKLGAAATPEIAEAVVAEVMEKTGDYAYNTFIQPLYNEVDGMTISRLAEFAESLVGLQATAAKTLDEGPATVGGYIEVATIDKAEGVRWVKALDPSKLQ
jgi:hypothetical protein